VIDVVIMHRGSNGWAKVFIQGISIRSSNAALPMAFYEFDTYLFQVGKVPVRTKKREACENFRLFCTSLIYAPNVLVSY